MTKILFNGNRIIIDGHADTPEECKAITAMCDSMANNENFKTIVYEEGHAVFEQVSGGESAMFATTKEYVLASRYDAETGYSAAELAAKGTIKARLDDLEDFEEYFEYDFEPQITAKITALETQLDTLRDRLDALDTYIYFLLTNPRAKVGQYLKVSAVDEDGKITAFEAVSVPEYKLPYTASELLEKLSAIGNETVSDGGEADGN